jgi:hypothetical protein
MAGFKSTNQYVIKCKGSSQPFVVGEPHVNNEGLDYVDLTLGGGTGLSNNPKDYTVHLNGVELRVIKIQGKTLTVEIS